MQGHVCAYSETSGQSESPAAQMPIPQNLDDQRDGEEAQESNAQTPQQRLLAPLCERLLVIGLRRTSGFRTFTR